MQNICWHPLQVAIPLPVLHLAQGLRVSNVVINDFEKTIYEVYEIQLNYDFKEEEKKTILISTIKKEYIFLLRC